ncbi:MAG: histidine kinase [Chitinophagaceae bacterium]|nr:histidine kinase [Chitinophagaceae bacterium]MCW5905908.1 histidine kinase [Chitinophagaceae bacterium]
MSKKQTQYWTFQIAGWSLYALSIIFFAFVFRFTLDSIYWKRIFFTVVTGIAFTHLLRLLIQHYRLKPPLKGNSWIKFFVLVLLICIANSLISSVLIQWLGWFRKEVNTSIIKRFVYTLFDTSPIILVWVSIYYIWHYVDDATRTEVDKIKLESLVKELELKTIKSHINPHFIFNALNSIRALVDENPTRARTAITELSNLLRSSMHTDKTETTSLENELNIVKDYLALEHIRFEDRLKVEYDIDEDTLDQPIPPMMLQNLVENAIKHGISKQKNGGTIHIKSDFVEDKYELLVQNTGTLNKNYYENEGFGIASTKNRLALLFGGKASFELNEIDNNMVEAKIMMPVSI